MSTSVPNPKRWLRTHAAHLLALLGGSLFLAQSLTAAHSQASVLDEGLYLLKGFLFANGTYTPFQDFGPWTNHMPLSFLIPGWVQGVFGPGLRTGRYFAVVLGALMVAGVWVLTRRLSQPGMSLAEKSPIRNQDLWAALAVWAIALNPTLVKIYSVQASQGLVATLLVGCLVLVIGPDRSRWQLLLGSALAGAIPLTRINMLPVLPVILGYVFWEHGKRRGLESLVVGLGTFIGLHGLFWPGILRMWAPWFPAEMTPFLDAFRRAPGATRTWDPLISPASRLMSALQGLRFHLIPILGVAGALWFWPRKRDWSDLSRRRSVVTLIGLFLILLVIHAAAALGQSYCVFCFPVYLSFFSPIGFLVVAASLPLWAPRNRPTWLSRILLLVVALLVGLGSFDTLGAALVQQPTVVQFLRMEVPRTQGPGSIPLWGLLENLTGLEYELIVRETRYWGRILVSSTIGTLVGVGLLWGARQLPGESKARGVRAWILFLLAGLIFTPSSALSGGYRNYDCSGDVILAYEEAGRMLQSHIQSGDRLYWSTGESPVPLLYLPGVRLFPAQLNGVYSFKSGGEPEALARFGHWNQELAETWAAEADVILVNGRVEKDPDQGWLFKLVGSDSYRRLGPTNPVHPCEPDSQISVFVRESK